MLKIRISLKKICASIVLLLLSFSVFSQDMTAVNYVEMDLQARQATLDGVKDRLTLLELGAELDLQTEQDEQTQRAVSAVYTTWGTTSSTAIVWASRHRKEIEEWLDNHPDYQTNYDNIARELEAVSSLIQALANG